MTPTPSTTQISADSTRPADAIGRAAVAAKRARLRGDLAIAARLLPTHYPLTSFIAVNPLAGLEHLPFGQALERAGALYGTAGTLPEPAFRALYAAGRIVDADLDSALARYAPTLTNQPDIRVGDRQVSAGEVMRADLLHGAPTPLQVRSLRTRSEQHACDVAAAVDTQTSKWCCAYLGADVTAWAMPGHEAGLYPAWRALAGHDRSVPGGVRAALRALPARADDAALHALRLLDVSPAEQRDYLTAHLTRQPGWAAHLKWRAEHERGNDLLDYLALRLTYEALLLTSPSRRQRNVAAADPVATPPPMRLSPGQLPNPDQRAHTVTHVLQTPFEVPDADRVHNEVAGLLSRLPARDRMLVWQDAYEGHYHDQLLTQLNSQPAAPPLRGRPAAQLVSCIDARSEGLRRHLEERGDYETLGFAGFFAVAIRYTDLAGGAPDELCPVLIDPAYDLVERPAPGQTGAAARRISGLRALTSAEEGFHAAKDDLLSPFALAEAAGWAAGTLAAAKTLAPRATGSLRARLHQRAVPPTPTSLNVDAAIPLTDRVLYAQVALTTMGLTAGFARLIVLCGHGSSTENNPYQAALDCGACGGHRGAPNARTASAIMNDADVRAGLADLGIRVPADTWFVAAEHDTATDQVTLLDRHVIPASHQTDAAVLATDLTAAGRHLSQERCRSLPGASRASRNGTRRGGLRGRPAAAHVQSRSSDWAQVFPEWGLAGNAAFLIGPRHLTKGIDLHRRAFLHSYDPAVDPDGTALETILTAPLVVAQWINAQYYFSTVAPDFFGAGTKTIHNVIAGIGVLAGHTGDLQLGLPHQSVALGTDLFHEPMRLLTVIQAPLDRIQTIIDRNPILQNLIGNHWLTVAARDSPERRWQRHTTDGWQPWHPGPI